MKRPFRFTAAIVCVLGFALFGLLCRRIPSSSDPTRLLSSPSARYWECFSNSVQSLDQRLFFPDGWPVTQDFENWFTTTTNSFARERSISAIIHVDRTNSIPFLRWLSVPDLDMTRERILAFVDISDTPPFWAANGKPRWTASEQTILSAFFRECFSSETNWRCRLAMDTFLLRTEPNWKESEERLRFLEDSIRMTPFPSTTNEFVRRIEKRLEPLDVEAHERLQKMLWR